MSGGPVLDTQGRVLGIHGRAEGESEPGLAQSEGMKLGWSLGIPANTLLGSLQVWGVERQWLQVETNLPPDLDEDQDFAVVFSLLVTLKEPPRQDAPSRDWINYGNQLWRLGLSEPAVEAFNQAILLDPNSYAAWYAQGMALGVENLHTEAVQSFEQAIATDKDNTHYEAWRERGKSLYILKQYPEALASIDQAIHQVIQRNNQDAVLYILRAAILEALNRHQEAVEAYTKAIKIKPHADTYLNRGFARYKSEDMPGAIADFNQAIQLNPQDAKAYAGRGSVRLHLENWSEAIADFDQVIKFNPQLVEAYKTRGFARYLSGDLPRAIDDYTEAIKLNPQDAEAYVNRGAARLGSRNVEGAMADFDQAIKINPQDAKAYASRSAIHYLLGNKESGIKDSQKAEQLFCQQGNRLCQEAKDFLKKMEAVR